MISVIIAATLQHSSRILLKSYKRGMWQKSASYIIKHTLLFTSFLPTLVPHFISLGGRECMREVLKSCGDEIKAGAHV